jgi:hypothetical protein
MPQLDSPSAPLSDATLREYGLAVRAGTAGLAVITAKLRQAVHASGARGLEADRQFQKALHTVIAAAQGRG